MGLHNIRGTTLGQGFDVAEELDVVRELGINIQGFNEINKPWSASNKWKYDMMMEIMFDNSRSTYCAMEAEHDVEYQPGGNFMMANGAAAARYKRDGSDKMGRFCWQEYQGGRDEGIVVITGYRVCQEGKAGPYTAATNQHVALREEGHDKPNPRRQFLIDLQKLIEQKRKEGFRPIVMMDANGDYNYEKDKDEDLGRFIKEAHLIDHFHEKFPEQIRTYVRGEKRLDYILMDPALVDAVERIGYLGTHEGTFSDHVLAYVDFNTKKLFKGVINRPVDRHAREFRLEQKDKVEKFLEEVVPQMEANNLKKRVFALAKDFHANGKTKENVRQYQKLDQQIREAVLATTKKVGKKKFGYMRSPELVECGRMLILCKMILDSKARNAPITPAARTRAEKLEVNIDTYDSMTYNEMRKEVNNKRNELWKAQKECEEDRNAWLQTEAMARAKAAGDEDWEKGLKNMIQVAESRATNRKLTAITKGRVRPLDRVEVPKHDWYYSKKYNELYHYDQGNFEAYPNEQGNRFMQHHTLKVPYKDAIPAIVRQTGTGFEMTHKVEWWYWYSVTTGKLYHKGEG